MPSNDDEREPECMGLWTRSELLAMDTRFCAAMAAASSPAQLSGFARCAEYVSFRRDRTCLPHWFGQLCAIT
jgi:hypothetical protein